MPTRPLRVCGYPGCGLACRSFYCEKHESRRVRRDGGIISTTVRSSTALGYGYRWQKARMAWLHEHPICVRCGPRGIITTATIVDHKQPHKGDPVLFWNKDNWQSLCKPCHDSKTAREDSGRQRQE